MSSVVVGALAACAASSLYNLGLALQALDAREAPAAEALQPSLLLRLARRRRWLAGTALNILGWPLQAAALLLAPLAVVQPSLAFGLVLLLVVAARHLGERAGPREAVAVLGILVGVALLAAVAPDPSTRHAAPGALAAVLGGVAAVALIPFFIARGRAGTAAGVLMTLGAGAALAWSGLSTKLVADALHGGQWGGVLLWAAATGLASGIGLLAEMSALQRRPATQVAPVVFVVQVLVPVFAAPLLVHEHWRQVPLVLLGIAVVVGCALALLRSPVVRSLVDADASSTDSGSARSPRAESRAASRSRSRADDAGGPSGVTTTMSPADGSGAVAASEDEKRS
jgi:drug/metabolite transporter (DMT)-like permease